MRHAHRPGHEQLERRALLSAVPNDALADAFPAASPAAVTAAADDAVPNNVTAPVVTSEPPTAFRVVNAASLAADLAGRLQASIDVAQATLTAAFTGPALDSILGESFGRAVTDSATFQAAVTQLRGAWQRGELAVGVEIRPAADMLGHPAAYAANGPDGAERIYVNEDWLLSLADASRSAGVLLEEFGHAIDRRLNAGVDSIGDEGELFSDLVTGAVPAADEFARIIAEDDAGTLVIDGAAVGVEFAARTVVSVVVPDATDGFYATGDAVDVAVTFSGTVNVSTSGGTPSLTIRIGTNSRTATYASGSGNSVLVFRYTIQAGDSDTDGISISSGSISLNGGTIKNGPDSATLTFSAVAANANAAVYNGSRPTLTTMSTLTGATEDTAFEILYSALTAAGNEANATAFRIESVTTGSLSKWNGSSWVAVTAGATTIGTGEKLQWTPAANANGSLNAFTVRASSGTVGTTSIVSSTAVQVAVSVAAVNDAPTLTSIAALPGGTEDTPLTISYAALLGASDAADAEGSTLSFRIEAVSTGTLAKWNGSSWVAVTAGTTMLGTGEQLQWTPAANANGTLNAFTVKAYDGAAYSSSAVQVRVSVAAVNDAPTMTSIATLSGGTEDTSLTISYATLLGASDAADAEGSTLSFRIEAVSTGTLAKWNGSSWAAVTAGTTTLGTGEQLQWTPAANANGTLNAFTVKAYDGAAYSSSAVQVRVSVAAVNDAPTLTSIATLSGGTEDTPLTISYATLLGASDAADVEGSGLSFRIEAVSTGTLAKWNGSSWAAVTAGATTLGTGEQLQWTPAANANGTLNAFTVKAFDGAAYSAAAIQVRVTVAAVNDPATLTLAGAAVRGQTLTGNLVDADGLPASIARKWQRSTDGGVNWSDIAGATAATYTLTAADVGHFVRATAAYTDLQGNVESVASASSPRVSQAYSLVSADADLAVLLSGARFDPVNDTQSNAADTDLVGDAATPMLRGGYDSVNDVLYVRVRIGDPTLVKSGGVDVPQFKGVVLVGLDVNRDGAIDVMVGVDGRNNGLGVVLYDPGTGSNTSPSTTSVANQTAAWPSADGTVTYDTAARASGDAGGTYRYESIASSPLDLGSDGGTDAYLTFKVPFAAIAARVSQPCGGRPVGLSLTENSTLRFAVFTLTQNNSINGDVGGIGGDSSDQDRPWTEITDPISFAVPTLGGIAGVVQYVENAPAVSVAPNAELIDLDNPFFAGGSLRVAFGAGTRLPEDSLTVISGVNGVTVSGSALSYGGTPIGSFTWDAAGSPGQLVVGFTGSGVSIEAVKAVLRSIGYANASDAPSTSQRSLTVTVTDPDGNVSEAASCGVAVVAVNDAPSIVVPGPQSLQEEGSVLITGLAIGDIDAGAAAITATLSVGNGTLTVVAASGALVTGSGTSAVVITGRVAEINATLAASGAITYRADVNFTGSDTLSIQVDDGGNTGAGGTRRVSGSVRIDVANVNDAPAGADKSVTVLEDSSHTFSAADFGFSDASDSPANSLAAVVIATLPAAGTLKLGGVAVTAGQSIPVASLGGLTYAPAANANGSGYASFTFQVQDDGGTADGGVDLDQSVNTITVNVTSVNDAPSGADKAVTVLEDASYAFAASDFGFGDANDSPANSLSAVKIATLPAAGTLKLGGVPVTVGQSIPVASLGNLLFAPAANANGAGYASFTFQVQDDGGTANGGIDLDQIAHSITVSVTSVNDAPSGADKNVTVLEDSSYTFAASDFGFGDANDSPANSLSAVKIATLPSAGTLKLGGVPVTVGQSIPVASLGGLTYAPAANANGSAYASFTFQVQDDGGTANGGIDLDQIAHTITVSVTSVNDAPSGADKNVTVLEDSSYAFAASDFGFGDANDSPANLLAAVKIATLPAAGALKCDGVAVVAGDSIAVAELGKLVFTPAANANGVGYARFTFQVQDDGGTANGGVDLDPSANTIIFNTTSVNNAPAGSDNTLMVFEDGSYAFSASAFGFSDPNDSPANSLSAVRVSTLPAAGTLMLDGVAVTAGQSIAVADLGTLVYAPAANANGAGYASFTFQVQDDGGTADGGVDVDQSENRITFDVTSVNDAPTGADKTVAIVEDGSYAFSASDFGFADESDSPANSLAAVVIATLPAAGTLTLDGVAVTEGQSIAVADLGTLVYAPAANAHGVGYASFTFQVQDDGGTADGGVDLDPTVRTITVDVTSVNDAPAGTDKTVTILEDGSYAFSASDFGFADESDSPANALAAVVIATLPAAGTLTLDGVAVTEGQSIAVADLGTLVYAPAANAHGVGYASFTFQVQDDGGTADGGVDLDPTVRTITVDVTSINDAPAGTDKTVTLLEDGSYTFSASDFGFSDEDDGPANALAAVVIATLPAAGTLMLDGVAVAAGQSIAVADLGTLVYAPAANANGAGYASFTFQVQDDGGTADGGDDLDPTVRTITFDVTSVNDAPAGTDKTVTILEDGSYAFSASDFGFSDEDDSPANALAAVVIATLPATGTLKLDGVAVAAGQSITAADLGTLVYAPAANAHGVGYASFTFQVQDDGGTADGGVDLDPTVRTITVDVTSVNDAPAGTDATVWAHQREALLLTDSDFGFSDLDGNERLQVVVASLPTVGTLQIQSQGGEWGDVTVDGTVVSFADIMAGRLRFVPELDAVPAAIYVSFTFQVQDDGGVANGGQDTDQSANTLSIGLLDYRGPTQIVPLEQYVDEDHSLVFSAGGGNAISITFLGEDEIDNDVETISTSLSVNRGTLTLSGVAGLTITSGGNGTKAVTVQGKRSSVQAALEGLMFSPEANQFGHTYAVLTIRTANVPDVGGMAYEADVDSVDITVNAVNDAPAGADKTVTVLEDGSYAFTASDFGFTDPDDSPANSLSAVTITTLPAAGTLKCDGVPVTAGQSILVASLGKLVYAPAANANGADYASFTFQVQDDGGTANGGASLDPVANVITIDVTSVADAASFSGDDVGRVMKYETVVARGTLVASDFDAGQSAVNPQSLVKTPYGTFSIDADGHWAYSLDDPGDNPVIKDLDWGHQLSDRIEVESVDGTKHTITITIDGNEEDGIPAVSESLAPGAPLSGGRASVPGDANGDGVPDFQQSNVATAPLLSVRDFQKAESGTLQQSDNATFGSVVADDTDGDGIPDGQTTQLRDLSVQPVPQAVQEQLAAVGIKVVSTKIGFTAVDTGAFVDVEDILPGVQQRYTIILGSPVDADAVLKIVNGTALVMPLGRDPSNVAGYAELKRNEAGLVTGMVLTITDNGIYDLDPASNSIVDPVALGGSDSDLAVAVTDNSVNYIPGSTVTYTVTVSNLLASPAVGAMVTGGMLPGATITRWTAVGGTSFTGAGTDASPIVVDVPANGSVVFTVTATVAPTTVRGIALLVTARPAAGQVDANDANNAAADADVPLLQPMLVVGSETGCQSDGVVRIISATSGETIREITPWEQNYRGGIRAVPGDVDGDGVDEIVMVSGRSRPTEMRVFTQWGYELQQYRSFPFGKSYAGGADVAVGNVIGDDKPEIVLSMLNGRSLVAVFQVNPALPKPVAAAPAILFQPFARTYTGGAAVTIADVGRFVNGVTQDATAGDGRGEVVVASGVGMRATVKVYELSGASPRVVDSITPFAGSATVGPLAVSSGRFNDDTVDDIAVTSGRGIKSAVEVYSGRVDDVQDVRLLGWTPFPNSSRPTASLTAVGIDSDRDGKVDRLAGAQGIYTPQSVFAAAPVSLTGTLLAHQAATFATATPSKAPRLAAVNNRPVTPAITRLFASLGSLHGAGPIAAKQAAFAALVAANSDS